MGKDDLDQDGKRFEFKAGLEGFSWGGMLTEGGPASNPVNRPRLIVNGRNLHDEIVERAGLAKFNATPLHAADACIRHIDDFQIGTPTKLWSVGDGCPAQSTTVGFHLSHIDQEQSPEYQRAVWYDTAATTMVVAKFDGALHIGVDAQLKKLQLIVQPYGIENIAIGGRDQSVPLATFNLASGYDANYVIRCMQEFDGKLFIGLDNGAGASKIVVWDGVCIRDDLTGINVPTAFGLYRVQNGGDSIVVGFAAATNHIRYRPTGDAPGTWTTVAPGAGTISSVSMAPYKDVLYIADDSGEVWSYNGTTLASAHTPAGATAVRSVTTFNRLLYFAYETGAAARIGKFDGTTWTDVEKDLTVQFSGTTSVRSIKGYRNSLYAAGVRSAGRIWFSPETATSGAWTEIIPNATTGDVDFLLVA